MITLTREQLKILTDRAWEKAWYDHLRGQKEFELKRQSFNCGYVRCARNMRLMIRALKKIKGFEVTENTTYEMQEMIRIANKALEKIEAKFE